MVDHHDIGNRHVTKARASWPAAESALLPVSNDDSAPLAPPQAPRVGPTAHQ
ncbi:hypothetical protein GCM10027448_02100 [Nocardioides dilutus]